MTFRWRDAYSKLKKSLMLIFIEHTLIFNLLLIYLCYAFYIEYRLANWHILNIRFSLFNHFSLVTLFTLVGLLIVLYATRVIKDDIPGLLPKWLDIIGKYITLRNTGSFIFIYLMLPIIVSIFESLKRSIPLVQPFDWDVTFMKLDHLVHFNNHPWVLLLPIVQNNLVLRLIDQLYVVWFLVLHFMTFWLAWSQQRKLRMQFFLCNILILFIIGNILATVFSSAGPCYYAKVTEVTKKNPFEPLLDKLAGFDKKGPLIALTLQNRLWENHVCKEGRLHESISAMPSVHVAFATLFALTVSSISLPIGLIFWGYWAVVQVGSIILGWHYAIDGYFATILTLGLWKISGYINKRFWDRLPERIRSQLLTPNGG